MAENVKETKKDKNAPKSFRLWKKSDNEEDYQPKSFIIFMQDKKNSNK